MNRYESLSFSTPQSGGFGASLQLCFSHQEDANDAWGGDRSDWALEDTMKVVKE